MTFGAFLLSERGQFELRPRHLYALAGRTAADRGRCVVCLLALFNQSLNAVVAAGGRGRSNS